MLLVCCHPHTGYYKTSNISRTLVGKLVDHSDVVRASPVGAAPISIRSLPQFHQQNSVSKIECSVDNYSKYSSANVDCDFVKASIEIGSSVQIRESLM